VPPFRVQTTSGSFEVKALRAVIDGDDLAFEGPGVPRVPGPGYRVPHRDVVKVTRRVIEVTGAVSWVTDRPRLAASPPRRPKNGRT
jgi:hypothetical protein